MQSEILRYCAEWPASDRADWLKALEPPKGLLQRSRIAANWREQTSKDYTIGYTHGLRWLSAIGSLEASQPPADRWNPLLLNRYVRELHEQGYAPPSIHTRLISIERVLSQIASTMDRGFIALQLKKLSRYADGVSKIARLKESAALRDLGCVLMDEAERCDHEELETQRLYRDGFLTALLAVRPLRLKNYAQLTIGEHIFPVADGYWINIPRDQTKIGREVDLSFPSALISNYERYVGYWREKLRRKDLPDCYQGRRLWVSSTRRGPQGENSIVPIPLAPAL